jgi:DNA-binding response OmpR family regulator
LISWCRVTSITSPAAAANHHRAMAITRLRIVVADDNPDIVASLRLLLEEDGHAVKGVPNGQQALIAVRDFGADVLLLDIGMPDMTGFAVAHTLRERYGSAKPVLIAITGRDSGSDRALARSMGFDHYVAKPYDPNEVLALVAGVRSASQ